MMNTNELIAAIATFGGQICIHLFHYYGEFEDELVIEASLHIQHVISTVLLLVLSRYTQGTSIKLPYVY